MQRIRIEKNRDYTIISNVFLRDKNISLKAKGLLSLIMSLPEDWDFSGKGITEIVKESSSAVYSCIDELIANGYCKRVRITDKGRFVGYEYTFFEKPNTEKPNTEKPNTEKPNTEKPYLENKQQINKEEINKEEINKDLLNKECAFFEFENSKKENDNNLEFESLEIKKTNKTKAVKKFTPPTLQEITNYIQVYCQLKNISLDFEMQSQKFYDYYTANGWRVGRNAMKDWQAAARNWIANTNIYNLKPQKNGTSNSERKEQFDAFFKR